MSAHPHTIDELLQTPYWVIDVLPMQVPPDAPGQYFAVERYWREREHMADIKRRHLDLVLGLNCYMDLWLDDEREANPAPERIEREMRARYVNLRMRDALIVSEPEDTHLTLFNANPWLLSLTRELARAQGLFVWQP